MSETDPPRLPLPDTPEALRRGLEAARADLPSPAQLAALAARLPPSSGGAPSGAAGIPGPSGDEGGPAPAPPAPSAGPSPPSGAALRALLPLAGGGAVLLLGVVLALRPASAPPSPPAPSSSPTLPAPVAPAPVAPAPVSPLPAPVAAAPVAPLVAPSPASPAAPSAAPSAASPSPGPGAPSSAPPPSIAPAAPPEVAAPATDTLPAELALLQAAQAALAGDPARALVRCEEHAATFPDGVLAQEREVVAITALVALDRHDEARARAAAFRARWPGSAHQRRVEAVIAGG